MMLRLSPSDRIGHLPAVACDERVYAIGDIHGRFDLMIALLRDIDRDARRFADGRRPRLIFLGDYIDRGEQSRQVLRALSALAADGSPDLVFLRGNHEAALCDFLLAPEENTAWLQIGGRETLASFGIAPPHGVPEGAALIRLRDALAEAVAPYADFLDGLEGWHRSGDTVFVHAAVDPARPIERQDEASLYWGDPAFLVHTPVPGLRFVHGHYDAADPVILPGRLCVDTGAYYTGVLSAARLDSGEAILSAR